MAWPAWTKFGTLGILAGLLTLAIEREQLFDNNLIDLEDYERHNANITCACGNVIQTRSLNGDSKIDICNACHPFFTGKQKLVDAEGRVMNARVISARPATIFNRSVLNALGGYQYLPRFSQGRPVIHREMVEEFNFKLVEYKKPNATGDSRAGPSEALDSG